MGRVNAPRFSAEDVAVALSVESVDFLGAGAFGDTWRAGDTAVKIICVDGYPPERVGREVAGLLRVDSDHVVKLLAAESVTLGGQIRPALTFEYIDGGDLEARFNDGVVPTPAQTRDLLLGLLRGLADLHAADGTLHRDIKPPNIALRDGDWAQPVLLDLGLARSTTETTVTMYPGRLGTAPWMAPEQLRAQPARKASDLFGVGVTVRTLASGEHPFYEPGADYTYDEALAQVLAGPKPLPETITGSVRTVLDLLVRPAEFERGSARSNLRRLEQA